MPSFFLMETISNRSCSLHFDAELPYHLLNLKTILIRPTSDFPQVQTLGSL